MAPSLRARGPLSRLIILIAVAWIVGACGDDVEERATLAATLVSPHPTEAAAVLELIGRGLENPGSAVARTFSHQRGDTLVLVLVSETPRVLRFTVDVPNPDYTPEVRILEVADMGNRLRTDLGDYRVEFQR